MKAPTSKTFYLWTQCQLERDGWRLKDRPSRWQKGDQWLQTWASDNRDGTYGLHWKEPPPDELSDRQIEHRIDELDRFLAQMTPDDHWARPALVQAREVFYAAWAWVRRGELDASRRALLHATRNLDNAVRGRGE